MANSLVKPTHYSKRYQAHLRARNITRQITSSEEKKNLTFAATVSRPYSTPATVGDITMGTATYTAADVTTTSETLTVNKWHYSAIKMTKDQELQAFLYPKLLNDQIDAAAWALNQKIDRTVLGEYSNASYETTATTYTADTIYAGMGEAHRTLRAAGVDQSKPWFMVGDPNVTQLVQNSQAARATSMGDNRQPKGFGVVRDYAGFRLFESAQALTWTGLINVATNPSEGDTVVIDGVTFTFNAAPSGAGSVDIGGTAAASLDNLVLLINAPSTTTATGIALSTADALKFAAFGQTLIAATDNATYVTITSTKGRITLDETFTAAGDNVGTCVLHCLAGQFGSTDTVFQADIETERKDVSGAKAKDYVTDVIWGLKSFAEGCDRLVDFQIKTQADTATA